MKLSVGGKGAKELAQPTFHISNEREQPGELTGSLSWSIFIERAYFGAILIPPSIRSKLPPSRTSCPENGVPGISQAFRLDASLLVEGVDFFF